jgi:hypothetical protein
MNIEITLTYPACVSGTLVLRRCLWDSYVFLLKINTLIRIMMEVRITYFVSFIFYLSNKTRQTYICRYIYSFYRYLITHSWC